MRSGPAPLRVGEVPYVASLPRGLHGARVVVPADEGHGSVCRHSVENSHTRQGCSCPPAATAAGDLDAFVRCPGKRLLEHGPSLLTVLGEPEVGPVQPSSLPRGSWRLLAEQMERERGRRSCGEGMTQAPAAHQGARGEPHDPEVRRAPVLSHIRSLSGPVHEYRRRSRTSHRGGPGRTPPQDRSRPCTRPPGHRPAPTRESPGQRRRRRPPSGRLTHLPLRQRRGQSHGRRPLEPALPGPERRRPRSPHRRTGTEVPIPPAQPLHGPSTVPVDGPSHETSQANYNNCPWTVNPVAPSSNPVDADNAAGVAPAHRLEQGCRCCFPAFDGPMRTSTEAGSATAPVPARSCARGHLGREIATSTWLAEAATFIWSSVVAHGRTGVPSGWASRDGMSRSRPTNPRPHA